jgi:hypothetical protein
MSKPIAERTTPRERRLAELVLDSLEHDRLDVLSIFFLVARGVRDRDRDVQLDRRASYSDDERAYWADQVHSLDHPERVLPSS